ncbi:hypothetical protein F4823DRAFT_217500 [Ustulina deusta]|nr:hypothetical protein F4823DRAFT_217500 [Ustulina deusta]
MSGARLGGEPATQREGDTGALRSQHGIYSRPTVPKVKDFGDMAQDDSTDTEIQDLIQFFKKTPPPPTNYMSIPDHFSSSSEDDRWDKFKRKVFRYRRKARKRRPPVITLPDTAVSARTTGGHRYIAISIPMQYSPLAPLPSSQYPVFDSIEAAFQREVNSMFGMWKKSPSNRLVTVLNPVAEDHESMSSSSPPPTVSERPEQPTILSSPSRRARSHSIPLLPSQEQRYTPRKARDVYKSRSVGSARSVPHPSDPAAITQSSERKHMSLPITAEMTVPRSRGKDVPAGTASKDTDVTESSTSRALEKPIITLTFPPRKSSRRGKGSVSTPRAMIEKVISTSNASSPGSNESNTNSTGNGSGMSSGDRPRHSFAASIDTTGSSPQLLKAQTATAYQSVPIVVTQSGVADPESPLDLNSPEAPAGKEGNDPSAQAPPAGPPPPISVPGVEQRPQRRKQRVRERRQRDTERPRAQMEHKGKGKEPVSQPFTPDMPASLPKRPPDTTPGHSHHHEREDTRSAPTSSSPATSSSSTPRRGFPSAPSFTRRKGGRGEREARYIAKALAEERETLESLPREELIQRYEALREQRLYEREKRLRKLERSRDTWIRAVPMLLQDLNGLLREQRRILEGARLTYAFPTPAGSPEQQRQQQRRRRSRSVEVSSSSLSGVDPLGTRRSQSLHGSSESRPGHRSSGLRSG